MGSVKYIHLVIAAVIAVLLIGMIITIQPNNSSAHINLVMAFFSISVVIGIIFFVFQATLKNQSGFWFKPVSITVRKITINTVIILWLFLVGFIFFVFLYATSGNIWIILTVAVSCIIAIWVGKRIQIHIGSNTLLPYGISFIGALTLTICVFALLAFSGVISYQG